MIVAAIFGLDRSMAFPGWWALLPVIGTVLLIAAGPTAWINRNIFAHPACVYIGLISYPLYLWHWPLLSFARIVEVGEPPKPLLVACIAVSFVLAALTYELV
jgi:peptidoglycan/LPS O-acetylase OafA/YrhL